jgi:hypothetical protein
MSIAVGDEVTYQGRQWRSLSKPYTLPGHGPDERVTLQSMNLRTGKATRDVEVVRVKDIC